VNLRQLKNYNTSELVVVWSSGPKAEAAGGKTKAAGKLGGRTEEDRHRGGAVPGGETEGGHRKSENSTVLPDRPHQRTSRQYHHHRHHCYCSVPVLVYIICSQWSRFYNCMLLLLLMLLFFKLTKSSEG